MKAVRRRLDIPSGLIWGSDFSDVTSLRSSGLRLHTLTPSAAPAAIAAPSAVVSGMDGLTVVTAPSLLTWVCHLLANSANYILIIVKLANKKHTEVSLIFRTFSKETQPMILSGEASPTGTQRMSACSCISSLLDVIPPSTCSCVSGIPLSWFMASRICTIKAQNITQTPGSNTESITKMVISLNFTAIKGQIKFKLWL